jgi:RND family efflux transporter MFP subunit
VSSSERSRWASGFALWVAFGLACLQPACGDPAVTRGDGSELAITAPPETKLRVRTQRVRRARLSGTDRVTGTVRAFHRATVTAETQGRVVARSVAPGAAVEQDGLLIELESSRQRLELARTEAALQAAGTILKHAERELARGERLAAESAISEQRMDDLRLAVDRARDERALAVVARDTARRDLADTRIRAPFAGTVDSFAVDIGDYVAPGTAVATLVDLARVRIFAGVTAGEAARLEPGLTARASFADLGGRSFDATLMSVGRVADPGDGTYEIELWMENADPAIRDGLVARIELPDVGAAESLLAPRAALLRRDGRPEVFVVVEEAGRPVARSRALRTGRNDGEWIEILEGLQEGEEVVFDGHFALEDGSVVVVDGASRTRPDSQLEASSEARPDPRAESVAESGPDGGRG